MLDGAPDPTVRPPLLLDDGLTGDVAAGDGIYTAAGITHLMVTARESDIGPRVVRIAAEVEDRLADSATRPR